MAAYNPNDDLLQLARNFTIMSYSIRVVQMKWAQNGIAIPAALQEACDRLNGPNPFINHVLGAAPPAAGQALTGVAVGAPASTGVAGGVTAPTVAAGSAPATTAAGQAPTGVAGGAPASTDNAASGTDDDGDEEEQPAPSDSEGDDKAEEETKAEGPEGGAEGQGGAARPH